MITGQHPFGCYSRHAQKTEERLVYTVCACVYSSQDVGSPGYFLILLCYVTSELGLDIVYLSGYYNGV